jgi:hypothetical protein
MNTDNGKDTAATETHGNTRKHTDKINPEDQEQIGRR